MYVMNISGPNGAAISIPFEDESRAEFIKESAMRVISYVKQEITWEELDFDSLAEEVQALSGPAH